MCFFIDLNKISSVRSSDETFTRRLRLFGEYAGRLFLGRIVQTASRPARPRRAAPPCAQNRTACGMLVLAIRQVSSSEHALHGKRFYNNKETVGALISSQDERALLVPRINREKTDKPVMNRLSNAGFVPPSFYICFACSFFFPNMPRMTRVYRDK